jgi:hypothetical protein
VTTVSVHLAIVAYVGVGWLGSTRIGLLIYLLLIPAIVLQWLLNAGTSILENVESLIRTGRWRDPRNSFEGHLFQESLRATVGIMVSNTLINVLASTAMLMFWIAALYRMVLIPTAP